MRQSLVGNLLFLCVFVQAGQFLAQETPSSSPPPSIASTSGNETDALRRLLLLRAKTVYLAVQLEPDAREGPGAPEHREKLALKWLGGAMIWDTRLKVVKNRKDADLLFLLVEGNAPRAFSHVVMKEKLLVLPGAPAEGDLRPLWESDWYEGEMGEYLPALRAVTEFRSLLEKTLPEVWIGAQRPRPEEQDDESPVAPGLTSQERRVVLLSAKTIALLSFGPPKKKGDIIDSFLFGYAPPWEWADATRARADVETALRMWNRYSLVEDPRDADLLLLITVWNEKAEKIGRVQHQDLIAGLKIYRGRAFFGNPQVALWLGKESAKSGRSTRRIFEKFRKDIEELMKQTPEKETALPAQLPPKTDP